MQIRLATQQDIPTIMELVQRVLPAMQAADNHQWDEHYPNPEVFAHDIELGQLWVADIDSSLAGVAAIVSGREPLYAQAGCDPNENAVTVHRLAVDPAKRGLGIAYALMQQAEHIARTLEIAVLRADTSARNEATQRLFPKLGYRLAGEMKLDFRPGQTFFCYEKRLPTQ